MAKDKESLNKSREQRLEILLKFGGVIPESIMKHNKSESAIDFVSSGKMINKKNYIDKKQSETQYYKSQKLKFYKDGMEKEERDAFSISGVGRNSGTLSLFSQNVGRNLINLYTKEHNIIIDPFAGHNSRMQLCFELKRNYYGCDICHEFMEMNKEIRNIIKNESPFIENNSFIKLYECDSRKLPFKDDFGDFTITSPPYWDMEHYGDEKEQLEFSKTYSAFLMNLQLIMKENYRCLKKGAFCVWFVNDFRKKGIFYNYHGDIINKMTEVGFIYHDIIIVDLGTSFRAIFASQIIKNKIVAKRHEYALVFKK